MSYVDIVSRFGELTMRLEPVVDPEESERAAWNVRITGKGPLQAGPVLAREDPDEPQTLLEFFDDINAEQRGWDGEKRWQSLFGNVKITADHDQVNSVRLYIEMRGGPVPQWVLNIQSHTDPGLFAQLGLKLDIYMRAVLGEVGEDEAPARISPHDAAAIRAASRHVDPPWERKD